MTDSILLENPAEDTIFQNPIAERFFNNIDLATEEYIQNGKEHSLATIAGIIGVITLSKNSPEFKNIAGLIESYSKHQQQKRV